MADEGKVVPSEEISSHYKTPPALQHLHPHAVQVIKERGNKLPALLSSCFLDIRVNKLCFRGCHVCGKGGERVSRRVWESIIPLRQLAGLAGIARD